MQAAEVFTPGGFPIHTYVPRHEARYDRELQDALIISNTVISINGPSKSGKTVLTKKIVESRNELLVEIFGGDIESVPQFWVNIAGKIGVRLGINESNATQVSAQLTGKTGISGGLLSVISASGEVGAQAGGQFTSTKTDGFISDIKEEVILQLLRTQSAVFLDDFHYIDPSLQAGIAKSIKHAVQRGVRIITASALHKSNVIIRELTELQGRVTSIDLPYWEVADLKEIAYKGFGLLNIEPATEFIDIAAIEAAGSPQLMQSICLNACIETRNLETQIQPIYLAPTEEQRRAIFHRVSRMTPHKPTFDVMLSGPDTRGTERKIYNFLDSTNGDVYKTILKAIKKDPPRLSFPVDELIGRINSICTSGEHPTRSSVTSSCRYIYEEVKTRRPNENCIDWDPTEDVFDVVDPYLLFFIRWSGALDS